MTAYTLSPVWGAGAQLFDNSGNVLTGGKIYTYEAGTTTPAVTYTDPIGSTFNSNPIIADASGRLANEIWLPVTQSYKFVLKDTNDVLIATYDNIPTSPQPPIINDASSISYEQGYTVTAGAFTVGATYLITNVGSTNFIAIGAAANVTGILFTATGVGSGTGTAEYSRTVQAKLRETISVTDFGAVGDGVVDDTAAINAAFIAAGVNNVVFFPTGTYSTTAPIVATCSFYGTGSGTNFRPKGDIHCFEIQIGHANKVNADFIRDFIVVFDIVADVAISSSRIGMWLNKGGVSAATSGCNNVSFSGIGIWHAYYGIAQFNTDRGNLWNVSFRNIQIQAPHNHGVYLDLTGDNGSLNVVFDNFSTDQIGAPSYAKGVYINGIPNLTFNGISNSSFGTTGSQAFFLNCSSANIRMQTESISVNSANDGLVAFFNCPSLIIELAVDTITFNHGAGNDASYIYLDANCTNVVVQAITLRGVTITSGTVYKINCQGAFGATTTKLSLVDPSIAPTDVLAIASVKAATDFPTTNYALQKTATALRQQALDISCPAATATNLVSVADFASRNFQPSGLYLVQGTSVINNTWGFTDLILVTGVGQNVTQTAVAVSSNTISSGSARTYDVSGGFLRITATDASTVSVTGFSQPGALS